MYVVNITNGATMGKDFCVKLFYRGYEISATPMEGVNVYKDEAGRPIFLTNETGLEGILSAKNFIDEMIDCTKDDDTEWERIADADVLNVWTDEEGETTEVPPTFYAEAGTPVAENGEDMAYSYTIIRRKRNTE